MVVELKHELDHGSALLRGHGSFPCCPVSWVTDRKVTQEEGSRSFVALGISKWSSTTKGLIARFNLDISSDDC